MLEALAEHFEWFTNHPGISKESLSSMLHMQHNILPEENLLPDLYAKACKLIDPFLVKTEVYHACINDCILFRNKFATDVVCPKCNGNRYKHGTTSARNLSIFHLDHG